MRDPKRIKECLSLIRSAWESYPDLRLGQLIMNAAVLPDRDTIDSFEDIFYIEDDILMERIKSTYLKGENVEYHKSKS